MDQLATSNHARDAGSPAGDRLGRQARPGWQTAAVCLFLGLAVWAVFGQTLHHEFVNFDDDVYVYENRHVLTGLTAGNLAWAATAVHAGTWQPLVWLSLMLDCQLHGLHAGWFHLTNILLHAASAILLFLVLRSLTGALWRSAFVAALFAVHPLQAESVAWVTERKDVLSALFWMLTLWAYLRYVERPKVAHYLGALLCFALGLMAKPMLMTLPAVLLLLDWWPLQRFSLAAKPGQAGPSLRRVLLEKLPFIACSLTSLAITFFAQHQGSALHVLQEVTPGHRIALVPLAYVQYLGKTLWPARLYIPYLYADLPPWWEVAGACLVLAGLTFAAVKAARQRGYFLLGWLWYLAALIPVIGFVQVGNQDTADRFTYIPLVGIFIIIAWGAAELCRGWRYRSVVLRSAAAAILASLLAAAFVQAGYWKDSITLWTHTLACDPGNYVAHNNLGNAVLRKGDIAEAFKHYEQALRLNPDYTEAHNNLGLALASQGNLPEAIKEYEQALRLSPNYAIAYNNLGTVLMRQGNLPEAMANYERMLTINNEDSQAQAHNNLGNVLASQGKLPEAREHYEQALRINPDYAEAHYNAGLMLASQGSLPEAVKHYEQALRIKPDYAEAHNNLGNALADQGSLPEAIRHFEQALQCKPNYAEAHYNAGNVLFRQGTLPEAIRHFEQALQCKPNYAEAHFHLGLALGRQGKSAEATPHLQQALALATAQNNTALANFIRSWRNPSKVAPHLPPQP